MNHASTTATRQAAAALPLMRLDPARVARAKVSYAARRVPMERAALLMAGDSAPRAGDLVLARVERLGQHERIELGDGRRATLHAGDEIVLCYANRYAPDQFEAFVPADLGPCDMVAAGGIAARCVERHGRMKRPSRVRPLGLLADAAGERLNLDAFALPAPQTAVARPPVYLVCGAMMNAGKTTMAAHLVRGLRRGGRRVGAAKVTGTGAGGDRWVLQDAGADLVLDFTDCGLASTFGVDEPRLVRVFDDLVGHLAAAGMEAIVLEIADGIYQRETRALLESAAVRERCTGVCFAAQDALSAVAGTAILSATGHRLLAVGGALTASPLAVREARGAIDVPVLTSDALAEGRWLGRPARPVNGRAAASPYVKWVSADPVAAEAA